jgi:hypothetical protein
VTDDTLTVLAEATQGPSCGALLMVPLLVARETWMEVP